MAQITSTKVATKKSYTIENNSYDSTLNFLGKDVNSYIGQMLYLTGKSEVLRQYGYEGFILDYTEDIIGNEKNVYKCCDNYNSKYTELNGKYFRVLDVIKHPNAEQDDYLYGSVHFLKLEEKDSKDIVYFEYDSKYKHSFPFIVVGFFEKQKKLLINQEFVFTDRILKVSSGEGLDIKTGAPISIKTGEKWKCKDLTVEERYYSLALVLENSLGEITTVSYDATFDNRHFAYTIKESDFYKEKFGSEIFELILQGKVKVGMTREMCILSLGEPKSKNETVTSGHTSEQWIYTNKYLFFDNGILTLMQ
jgi:hypothetical protein